jgi:hypothetical protein
VGITDVDPDSKDVVNGIINDFMGWPALRYDCDEMYDSWGDLDLCYR